MYQNNETRQGAALAALIAVTVLHGMIHGYSIFLSPLNEQMRIYFGAGTITAITAMKATYLVVYAAGNLVFGVLTNRLSARATLAAGMILNGIAITAFAGVGPDGLLTMHLLWMLAAVGGSVYHPIANVLITRLYPNRKGMVLGVTGVGAATGFAFAPLITGLLAGLGGLGWQQIAVIFGIAGIMVGVLSWFFVPGRVGSVRLEEQQTALDSSRRHSPESDHGRATLAEQPRQHSSISGLLIGLVIAIACLREIAMWSVLDISDFFLTALLQDSTRTGWFLFLLYLPGIFVKPLVGTLSDRYGRKLLATAALLFYGLTFVAAAAASPISLALVYLLMGVGQSATVPSIEAIIADSTTPKNRGIVFGVFVTAVIGLGALGPLLSGAVLDAWGGTLQAFRLWFVILGTLPFAGGICLALLRFPVRQGSSDDH